MHGSHGEAWKRRCDGGGDVCGGGGAWLALPLGIYSKLKRLKQLLYQQRQAIPSHPGWASWPIINSLGTPSSPLENHCR